MTSISVLSPPDGHRGEYTIQVLKLVGVACLSSLLMVGCGGGDALPREQPASTGTPSSTSTVAGDVLAPQAVPIVVKPASGDCGISGAAVQPSALLNSQLDCAP